MTHCTVVCEGLQKVATKDHNYVIRLYWPCAGAVPGVAV